MKIRRTLIKSYSVLFQKKFHQKITLIKTPGYITNSSTTILPDLPNKIVGEPEPPGMIVTVREEFIEVEPNVLLHLTDAGEGRPIVLLHGWPLSDEMFEYQYNDLLNHNFRVIGITLRGFGKSSKPYSDYSYDIHALDIKKILGKLDIKDAVLTGFSMGAAVAIRFASADEGARVSKLVLCGAAAPLFTQRADHPYNLKIEDVDKLIELNHSDRPQLLSDFGKIFASEENSLSEGIKDWLYYIGLSASSYAMGKCLAALRDTDLRPDLAKISIPVLIMHGIKDKICSFYLAEQLRGQLYNSRVIPFENSGHALFLEERKKFNSELIRFALESSKPPQ